MRLSFSLSALDVGPLSVVPLIESTTVVLSGFAKTWPRNPSIGFSHPIGNDCEPQYKFKTMQQVGELENTYGRPHGV